MTIPRRLIRTAPDEATAEMNRLWDIACDLHPDWEHVDIRNGIDPAPYPLTSPYWGDCESGAQQADLVRFEELLARGGVYIDSDVEVLRPFDALLGLPGFAGYENNENVCIAVLGFPPIHPVLARAIELAIARRFRGTWEAGMGAFQEAIRGRDDVVLFPPATFYPWYWNEPEPPNWRGRNPWSFTAHYWAHSWKEKTPA